MGLVEILWTVTGVAVPLLLGTAWSMVGLSPPEFWIARASIGISAIIFGGTSLIWLCSSTWPLAGRAVMAALIGATALLGFSEAIRFINNREAGLAAVEAKSIDKRAAFRAHLQQLFVEDGQLLEFPLTKDTTNDQFKVYENQVNDWVNSSASWIGTNLGVAAQAKFLDRTSGGGLVYTGINQAHGNIIGALIAFRKNLSTLIETSAWDKEDAGSKGL